MKKIVVLGSSAAALEAIEEIRVSDKESDVTVICSDIVPAAQRHLFTDFLAKQAKEEDLFYKTNNFYKEQRINVVSDKKIIKVDLKRNRLVSEEKEQFDFDVLIIADTGVRLPEIKGNNKGGVFSLHRLRELKAIAELLPVVETVVIQAEHITGLRIAFSFLKRGKEVILIIPSGSILPHLIEDDSSDMILKFLEKSGIRVIKENAINEILGEGEAKAVKLKTGKVFASQIIIFDDVKNDLRLFADSLLETQKGILVDHAFRTNLNHVFAVDMPAQSNTSEPLSDDEKTMPSYLKEQGKVVGLNIGGQTTFYAPSVKVISFEIGGLPVTLLGETRFQIDSRKHVRAGEAANQYQKIFVKDGFLQGAVLINQETQRDKMLRLINQKVDIDGIEHSVLEIAQDFESILKLSQEKVPTARVPSEDSA